MKMKPPTTEERKANTKRHLAEIAEFVGFNPVFKDMMTGLRLPYQRLILKCHLGQRSPTTAIKTKCLDCSCWDRSEVEQCEAKTCPLYNYRPYKNDGGQQ